MARKKADKQREPKSRPGDLKNIRLSDTSPIRRRVRIAHNARVGRVVSGRGVNPGERRVSQRLAGGNAPGTAELPKATGKRARTDKNRKQIARTYKYEDVTGISRRNKGSTKKDEKNPKR